MKIHLLAILVLGSTCITAAPLSSSESKVKLDNIQKREDSADRNQEAAPGGALLGIVVPWIDGTTYSPLGGQPGGDD